MARNSRDFRRLVVWQKSHQLAIDVYRCTESFPKSQTYRLVDQMQRAAISIPANIAEGCGRGTEQELARFMEIAQGSASELSYFFIASKDLGFIETDKADELFDRAVEVGRMLHAYLHSLRANG